MNYKKIKKVTIVLTVICAIVAVINISFILLQTYIMNKINTELDVSAIGIIGAADGPTSILVSNSNTTYIITTICALLSIAGIVLLIVIKSKKIRKINNT